MEFKKADKLDAAAVSGAKKNAYGYPEAYLEHYMKKLFFPEKCVVCKENGVMTSYVQRSDYGVNLRGMTLTAGCIGDVYTEPSKRRMGYMKGGINALMDNLNKEQIPFVFCVPFDYKIFDSLGFRLASDIREYHITADDIPAYKINGYIKNNTEFTKLDETFINKISDVYTSYMKRTDDSRFYTLRSNIYWENMLDDFVNAYGGNFAVLYDNEENISGYLLYITEKDKLRVYEYAYKNLTAYKSILAYLKNYKYQAKEIIIKAAEDDTAYLDFAGNNNLIKIMPFAMARITNISYVLNTLRRELAGINMRIFDPIIGANNGIWSINENGVMPASEQYDMETDIGTFTQLYLGYISASDAFYMGYLKNVSGNGEKEQIMRRLFKKGNNYINMLI